MLNFRAIQSIFRVTEFVQVHAEVIQKKKYVSYIELFRGVQPRVAQIPGATSP